MSQQEDKFFESGIRYSIFAHLLLLLSVFLHFVFSKPPTLIDISQAIRVDMVGLPEKLPNVATPVPIPEPKAEKLPTKQVNKPVEKRINKLPDKVKPAPAPDTKSVNLNKAKSKQRDALERLKKLSAIDKIKNEVVNEEQKNRIQQAAAQAIAKGRVISAGTAITGLDKIEATAYLQDLDHRIKQQWALPQWLLNKPLKARVLVKFNSAGQIISREMVISSGDAAYDRYCLQAIDQAAPFPKVPERFSEKFSVDGVMIGFPE